MCITGTLLYSGDWHNIVSLLHFNEKTRVKKQVGCSYSPSLMTSPTFLASSCTIFFVSSEISSTSFLNVWYCFWFLYLWTHRSLCFLSESPQIPRKLLCITLSEKHSASQGRFDFGFHRVFKTSLTSIPTSTVSSCISTVALILGPCNIFGYTCVFSHEV